MDTNTPKDKPSNNGVDAEIKIAHSHYTLGSPIQGTIILHIRRRVEHSGIYIRCYGCTSLDLVKSPRQYKAEFHPETHKLVLANTLGKDKIYMPSGVLDSGTMELPFEFLLLSDMPQSCLIKPCSGVYLAEIAHCISAALVFPGAMDVHVTKRFMARRPLTPRPVTVSKEIGISKYMFVRNMIVRLTVKDNVFQAGEDIPVTIESDQFDLLKSIYSISLFIERKVTAHFPERDCRNVDTIVSPVKPKFPNDARGAYTFDIKLPGGEAPSVVSETVNCKYKVVLRIEPSRFDPSKRCDIKLPVRVGFECVEVSKTTRLL
jgi:hypothetical protein